mmetsp:Transcript_27407/g.87103  ORF Transcript_27407/g.87103 Transcript_27407/m.87103 type:complete len:321 (+) Transcript_27407:5760-6722(+)
MGSSLKPLEPDTGGGGEVEMAEGTGASIRGEPPVEAQAEEGRLPPRLSPRLGAYSRLPPRPGASMRGELPADTPQLPFRPPLRESGETMVPPAGDSGRPLAADGGPARAHSPKGEPLKPEVSRTPCWRGEPTPMTPCCSISPLIPLLGCRMLIARGRTDAGAAETGAAVGGAQVAGADMGAAETGGAEAGAEEVGAAVVCGTAGAAAGATGSCPRRPWREAPPSAPRPPAPGVRSRLAMLSHRTQWPRHSPSSAIFLTKRRQSVGTAHLSRGTASSSKPAAERSSKEGSAILWFTASMRHRPTEMCLFFLCGSRSERSSS